MVEKKREAKNGTREKKKERGKKKPKKKEKPKILGSKLGFFIRKYGLNF